MAAGQPGFRGSSRWNASRLSLSVLVLELVLLMFQTVDADSCLVSKHVDRGEFDLECPVLCHNRPNKTSLVQLRQMFDCCHCANDAPFSSVSVAAITDAAMPADLLAGHVSEFLSFQCNHPPDLVFQVDPNAFVSTSHYTVHFDMYWCGLDNLDFLLPMRVLTTIVLDHLVRPEIDRRLDGLVADLFARSQRDWNTLERFACNQCGLEDVPVALNEMTGLVEIKLELNPISQLKANSLHLKSSPALVSFANSTLNQVHPLAIAGNFANTIVSLNHTWLTSLPERPFMELLDQMLAGTGRLQLHGVSLHCNCSMAWLVRRPKLLTRLVGGRCRNDGGDTSLRRWTLQTGLLDCGAGR